jgi:hypothetical protein
VFFLVGGRVVEVGGTGESGGSGFCEATVKTSHARNLKYNNKCENKNEKN